MTIVYKALKKENRVFNMIILKEKQNIYNLRTSHLNSTGLYLNYYWNVIMLSMPFLCICHLIYVT